MHKSASIAVVAALLATALLPSPRSEASSAMGIQKCSGPNGDPAYTDAACSQLGAEQDLMPEELLVRLARDEAQYGPAGDPGQGGLSLATGRRPVAQGCARSARQLVADLAGSMTLDDVNRIAESFDWAGMSTREGHARLEGLRALAGKQVQGGRYFPTLSLASPGDRAIGRMQLMYGDDGARRALQLDVYRRSGCYFARL